MPGKLMGQGTEGGSSEPARTRTGQAAVLPVDKVVVHPLVLLSVVDHFNRVSKTGKVKRVVGVLLGSVRGKILDIANSFAVPFDEDEKDGNVWFLDHDYLDSMYTMFRKVAAKEKIVGWYHTGPRLCPNDMAINEKMREWVREPVLVVVDAKPKEHGLPTEAYMAVEEIQDDGTPAEKTLEHLPSEIGAEEAEEVGVEHLLRDIRDQTAGTLSQQVSDRVRGLRGLKSQLEHICQYLGLVADGSLPHNHHVLYLLQNALHLLPDVAAPAFAAASNDQSNDAMLALFNASLARSVIALHDLIQNKINLRQLETAEKEEKPAAKEEKKPEADKEKNKKETTTAK